MKTYSKKNFYIFLASLFLGGTYLLPKIFYKTSNFNRKIPENPIRKSLIAKKNKKNLYKNLINR